MLVAGLVLVLGGRILRGGRVHFLQEHAALRAFAGFSAYHFWVHGAGVSVSGTVRLTLGLPGYLLLRNLLLRAAAIAGSKEKKAKEGEDEVEF